MKRGAQSNLPGSLRRVRSKVRQKKSQAQKFQDDALHLLGFVSSVQKGTNSTDPSIANFPAAVDFSVMEVGGDRFL